MNIDDIITQLSREMSKPKPDKKLLAKLNKALDKALGTELKEEDLEGAKEYEEGRDE